MDDLQSIRDALPRDVKGCQAIAERTGGAVGWLTVYRVATGRTASPSYTVVEHLKRAIWQHAADVSRGAASQ